MRKVYLLCEHWTFPSEESSCVLDVYQFEVDAIMECNRITVEYFRPYTKYSVETRKLK